MSADQPLLQVANRSVGKWDSGFRTLSQFGAQGLDAGDVLEASLLKTFEALEAVSIDGRAARDIPGEDRNDSAGFEVGNHIHASSAGGPTALFHGYRTRAALRFLSCRLPRSPACSPPTHVSSTSTSPRNGSRVAPTIARRSLCSIIQTVSYREIPS